MGAPALEFDQQPGLGQLPVAHDGFGRNRQDLGRLADAEAAEEPQLHDAALAFVHGGQPLEAASIARSSRPAPGLSTADSSKGTSAAPAPRLRTCFAR